MNLYIDSRVLGNPRYYLAKQPKPLMQIDEQFLRNVVFVGRPDKEQGIRIEAKATAFLVAKFYPENVKPDDSLIQFFYVVTAKHVLMQIDQLAKDLEREPLVFLRINRKGSGSSWIETHLDDWQCHTETDVAVYPLGNSSDGIAHSLSDDSGHDHVFAPISALVMPGQVKDCGVGPGDDIFITGLFTNHAGLDRNQPIVRVGNIAAMASPSNPIHVEGIGKIEAHLIEARSINGLSGSPVCVKVKKYRCPDEELEMMKAMSRFQNRDRSLDPEYYIKEYTGLLGLVHGHWDVDEAMIDSANSTDKKEPLNVGIGIVIPSWKIAEMLNDDDKLKQSEAKVITRYLEANAPTSD